MKTTPVSVRLGEADLDFLAALKIDGAVTPSEKMRALLSAERSRRQRYRDEAAIRNRMQERVNQTRNRLKDLERISRGHSVFWVRVLEAFPDLAAKVLSGPEIGGQNSSAAAKQFEAELQLEVWVMINEVLEIGLRESPATYEPELFKSGIQQSLETLKLIELRNAANREGRTD